MICNLKYYRELRGYTQEEVGNFVGLSRQFIGLVEKGRCVPNLRTAMLIARSLYVPVTSLFDFSDEMRTYDKVKKLPNYHDLSMADFIHMFLDEEDILE